MCCSTDGKTKCKRTLEGYECVCGDGYVPSDNGRCLKLNQCLASEGDLDDDCTCDRCACHDIPGASSYEYALNLCVQVLLCSGLGCMHMHPMLCKLHTNLCHFVRLGMFADEAGPCKGNAKAAYCMLCVPL